MKQKDKLVIIFAYSITGIISAGAIIGGLYMLAIMAGEVGARIWAIAATLAIPVAVFITYRLATHASREHLAGFDRGLSGAQRTVEVMGRSLSATASLVRSARPSAQNDDLLPLRSMQISEARRTDQIVEM